jgi:protein-tyrosine-phosphatase
MASSATYQDKKKVLFLCTHNSARSQMAEALLQAKYGDRYEAYSAGVEATSVDPRAVRAMLEIGINISAQRSKSSEEFQDTIFDLSAARSSNFSARIPEQERSFTKALRTLPLLLDQKKSSLRHSGRSETRLKNG